MKSSEETILWQEIQRRLGERPDGDPRILTARAVAKAIGIRSSSIPAPEGKFLWPKESDMAEFYGPPGTGLLTIKSPYQLYYDGQPINRITVHQKIAGPVTRVLERVLKDYGPAEIKRLQLDQYDGCYNNRNKRGGTSKSTHAYACALDFCAAQNPLHANHTKALFAKPEYGYWWASWESEGAISLGRERDFDWMHVQFARL